MSTSTLVVSPCTVSNGVLVLSGYGVRLAVERGHLIVEDGRAGERRRGRFARVGSGITRVMVLGHEGWVTLEALRWLYEIGAAFVQIGRDAELIASSVPRALNDSKLRRAQALAMGTEAGLPLARALIQEKIAGQARVVDRMAGHREVRSALAEAESMVADARSLDHLRFIESRAAAAYWSAWEHIPVRFAGRDAKQLPAHWRTFGTRSSPLTSAPRKAATPANALLNYLYTILEAETRLAALAVGCDPALGIIHTDKSGRDSLACDLMEPIRPRVDQYVLDLLASQTFTRSDFFETRDGNCRLMPTIARPLATTGPRWASDVAPVAEWIGGALRAIDTSKVATLLPGDKTLGRYRTPLTGANRSKRSTLPEPAAPLALPKRCRGCGSDLGKRQRAYCDACLPNAAREAAKKAVSTQQLLRAIGTDGRSADTKRAIRGAYSTAHATARRAWESTQQSIPSRATFRTVLAPLIAPVPIDDLVTATGLSRQSCAKMRRGFSIPHPRHWDALRKAAEHYASEHCDEPTVLHEVEFFANAIAPHLRALGADTVKRVTGLSASYSRRVLQGHHVPHVRHWAKLYRAVCDGRLSPETK